MIYLSPINTVSKLEGFYQRNNLNFFETFIKETNLKLSTLPETTTLKTFDESKGLIFFCLSCSDNIFFLLIARGQREKSNAVDLFVKAVTTNRSFISISIRLKSLYKAHFVSVEHQKLKREEAKNMKAYLIICILVCSFNLCRAEEVRKDFLIKNWWNRFLVWLVSRFQDKYEGQLSICTLSLYPPFEDIGL
jgi:HD-GYP domain-containing protein (c-di-GMP phosphodiesterase class II)